MSLVVALIFLHVVVMYNNYIVINYRFKTKPNFSSNNLSIIKLNRNFCH